MFYPIKLQLFLHLIIIFVYDFSFSILNHFKCRIEEAKNNAEKSIFLVTGEPGSGKTALVIDWLKTVSQEQPETLVSYIF